MSDETITVLISGAVSLIGAFGSILLKDHLDRRRMSTTVGSAGPAESGPRAAPVSAAPQSLQPAAAGRTGSIVLALISIAAGFAFGKVGDAVFSSVGPVVGVGSLFALPLLLLLFYARRRSRSLLGFELGNLGYWAALLAGLAIQHNGHLIDDRIVGVGLDWAGCAAVGALYFVITRRGRASSRSSAMPAACNEGLVPPSRRQSE